MTKALVLGGLTETERSMAGVVAEIKRQNLHEDVGFYEFIEAMDDPEAFSIAVRGLTVYTHSAGIVPLEPEHEPEQVFVFAGPEPMTGRQAKTRALAKTVVHGFRLHNSTNRRMVWESTKSLLANPMRSNELTQEIVEYSTLTELKKFKKAGITVATILSEYDEFFKPNDAYRSAFDKHGIPNVTLKKAKHDALILDPEGSINALKHFDD